MPRLSDAVTLRLDGTPRRLASYGKNYYASSAWTTQVEAREAAEKIRGTGGFALVTPYRRPNYTYGPYERRPFHRGCWVVWSRAELSAHAELEAKT